MPKKEGPKPEYTTLMEAFIYLTRNNKPKEHRFEHHGQMKLDTSDCEATRYLTRRLDMTILQVQVLACMIFHNQGLGRACDLEDLTEYMDAHPLELYTKQDDFEALINRGYIEQTEGHMDEVQWSVRREAITAITQNKPFDITSLRSADTLSFLSKCCETIREGRAHDANGEIARKIDWLCKLNEHLPVVINMRRLSENDDIVFKSLLLAAALTAAESAVCIHLSDFNMVLASHDVNMVGRAMQKGKFPLVAKQIFEPMCSDGGMANADQWVISKDGWMELLSHNVEEVNAIMSGNDDWARNLTPCTQIPECPLFFSGKTLDEVNRLRQLLQDDQYKQIVNRLKQQNMPTGFNILLYGTPGTGKTELVQQLARETGRDIFIVDMAQIRNKYVGESEHNLARIFTTYRSFVARMPKTPILFCNECDAIFGSRLERTAHSADKMENALQNILLEQMEKLRGIMICTTNLTSTLDKAFERRFLLKLQLPKPGNEARKQIWATMLPGLTDQQTTDLANRFDFSGGQIQNVTRKQIINSIFSGTDDLDFQRIIDDCNAETFDRTNGRQIGFK